MTSCTEPRCSVETDLRCARCGEPFCAEHLFVTNRDGDLCATDYNDIDDRLPEVEDDRP
ncbi:hypothetical protein [Plantactinospora sp. WMMB782]|uniref:hypothetical protein n=1 Tax=Plantactinospora sp. WMMB782 TaxID=3404121 RepID=UPI003B92F5E4